MQITSKNEENRAEPEIDSHAKNPFTFKIDRAETSQSQEKLEAARKN